MTGRLRDRVGDFLRLAKTPNWDVGDQRGPQGPSDCLHRPEPDRIGQAFLWAPGLTTLMRMPLERDLGAAFVTIAMAFVIACAETVVCRHGQIPRLERMGTLPLVRRDPSPDTPFAGLKHVSAVRTANGTRPIQFERGALESIRRPISVLPARRAVACRLALRVLCSAAFCRTASVEPGGPSERLSASGRCSPRIAGTKKGSWWRIRSSCCWGFL